MIRILILFFFAPLTISSLTTGVGTQSKTSGTTLAAGIGATTMPAGSLVVVTIASDNIGTTTDGDKGDITSVTDDAGGNTWTKAIQFTNVQGGANTGATVAIYYSVLNTALVTAVNSVTATWASNVSAKCIILKGFSVASGNLVAVEQTNTLAGDAADPASLSLTSLPSREYLVVRATAVETEVTTTTISTNYTAMRGAGNFITTTGGGAASNMGLSSEYRIVTTTSETTDPTIASADNASAMVAFYEYTPTAPTRSVRIINSK